MAKSLKVRLSFLSLFLATETKVNTRDLLVKIVESKFSTDREKRLARRLLTLVDATATINIVRNLTTPATYNTATNETSIDPRYSSIEYKAGEKGNPFEHVILNQTLMSIARQGLTSDSDFSDKITKLREAAASYQSTKAYKQKYGDKPMLAIADNAEFIVAALTNDLFQSALRETPYQTTGKVSDAWTDFVNSIKKFFARMFGVEISNTLLDESLYVISSKLDEEPIEPKGGETTTKPETTVTTPIDQIRSQNPVLYDDLLTAYKLFARKEGKTIPETDDEIGESLGFKNFVESNSDALEIISKAAPARPKAAPAAPTVTTEPIKEGEPVELDKDTEEKLYEEIELVLQTFDEPSNYKYQIVSNPKYNFEEVVLILGNKQWGIEAITNSNNYKQGDERAINLLKEQNRLQDILDERIRSVMEKYNLDFVKEQIPGAPAPAIVTEEPTTTAGVFTPTTPYGTPTGEPLTTATTAPAAPGSDIKTIERLSSKILNSPQGTINTGKLEEAVLPNTIIEEPIAQDRDGNWLEVYINNPKLQGTLLARNGNYLFRAMQGRFFVIAKVGNFYLPFYISSAGTSGKNEGEWYPFFGYNNWLVKGSVGKKGEMEYSEKISEVQKLLNDNFRIPAKYFTQFGQITNGKGTPANPDKVFYDINTHVKYESWFVDFDRQKDNKYTEEEFVADRTGLNPKNVVNDGKGSADSWIKDVVALTEDAEKASKGVISNAELAALEGKPAEPVVEETKEERLAKFKLEMLIIELKDVFKWDDYKKSYNRTAKLIKDKDRNTVGVDVLDVDRKVYTIEAANIDPELLRQLEEVERKYIFRGQSKEQLSNIRKEARALYKEIASKEIARLTGKEVIPTTEEKIKSLDDVYEDITSMEQLDDWYQRGIAEQIPSEILDEKRQNKINELAKKINFTDLKDWQEVHVKGDTAPRVVYDPTGEGVKKGEVILLYYGDYLAGDMKSAIKVTPENINSIIESIPNPAMKEAMPTGPTVTEEQVKESNATVNSLNNPEVLDDEQFKKVIEDAKAGKADDFLNMIKKEVEDNNNCSTSSGTKEE